jgi:hypothetical protein
MKTIALTISFIIWCFFTLFLAISLVGLVAFVREDYNCKNYQGEEGDAVWFQIGKKLINKLIE